MMRVGEKCVDAEQEGCKGIHLKKCRVERTAEAEREQE